MTTVLCATAVPLGWWIVVMPGSWDATTAHVLARLAVLSAVFWGVAARLLSRRTVPLRASGALLLGLASPLLCAALAIPFGLLLLPIDLLTGFPRQWSSFVDVPPYSLGLGWFIAAGASLMPLVIFPVGAGMGLLVGCVICRPGRRHC